MYAAYARNGSDRFADWREPEAAPPPVPASPYSTSAPGLERSTYGASRQPNWGVVLAILLLHALALGALISWKMAQDAPKPRPPLVVNLITIPTPPPASTARPPDARPQETPPPAPEIVTPAPLVTLATPGPSPIVAAPPPPTPRAAPATPAGPAIVAGPPSPVTVADLSATPITATPPKYPIESRRKREQGTVVLSVVVGPDGAVAELGISRSSGFGRLDKAALEAVRRWRWSPTLRDGQPVPVRGFIDFPFVLNG